MGKGNKRHCQISVVSVYNLRTLSNSTGYVVKVEGNGISCRNLLNVKKASSVAVDRA